MPTINGAALYFPHRPGDLHKFLPKARANGGLFRKTTRIDFDVGGQPAHFNFMPDKEIRAHVDGFAGYLRHLVETGVNTKQQVQAVTRLLPDVKCVLGLGIQRPFDLNSPLTATLFTLAYLNRGFVFTLDSVYSGEMQTLCGPVVLEPNRALLEALKAVRAKG